MLSADAIAATAIRRAMKEAILIITVDEICCAMKMGRLNDGQSMLATKKREDGIDMFKRSFPFPKERWVLEIPSLDLCLLRAQPCLGSMDTVSPFGGRQLASSDNPKCLVIITITRGIMVSMDAA